MSNPGGKLRPRQLETLVFKVARLPVALIAGSCVLAALAVLSRLSIPMMALHSMPIVLVTMTAFVLNDLYDVPKDRLAGADKPVALGSVSVMSAQLFAVGLIASALAAGALLRQGYSLYVVVAALIAVSLYSPLSRRAPWCSSLAPAGDSCVRYPSTPASDP